MKIDLSKLQIKPTLGGEVQTADMYKPLAESIYSDCKDLATMQLAQKLYNAKGDIEITETERQTILSKVSSYTYWAQQPLLDALGEKIGE